MPVEIRKVKGLSSLSNFGEISFDLIFATMIINVFSLALPLTLMQVYDRIIPFEGTGTLFWFVSICFIAVLFEGLVRYSRSVVIAWAGAKYDYKYSCAAVDRVLKTNMGAFEKDGLGVHLDRVNSVGILKKYRSGQVLQNFMELPFAALFVGVIWYLGREVAFVPLGAFALFAIAVLVAKAGFGRARKNQTEQNNRRFNFVIELLSGLHLVKSQSLEEQMLRRYERLQATLANINSNVTFWNNLPVNLGGVFGQLALLGVIGFGATKVMAGDLTLGGLAACTLLAGRAFQPIQSGALFWLNATEASIAKNRLNLLLSVPYDFSENIPPFPSDIEGGIELQKISFRYGEDQDWVLKDAEMRVPPGQLVGVLGKSSSGTSTLMNIFSGRLRPESGRVLIDDYDLSEWDVSSLKGRIEYVPQTGSLFEGTVLENIAMFNNANIRAALDAADLLGLDELVSLLPHGYETRVDSQASNFLPNGLIQRICIARSLVLRPRIIIFDKTAASMDNESEDVFASLIQRLKGNTTVILVTAHAPQLRSCDAVYEIEKGRLIERDMEWL